MSPLGSGSSFVHKAVRMAKPVEPLHHLRQDFEERPSVLVIQEDGLPGVAAAGDVWYTASGTRSAMAES